MILCTFTVAKQQKSLKAKIGGAADETQDDNEDDQDKSVAWGRSKRMYYETNKVIVLLNSMDLFG